MKLIQAALVNRFSAEKNYFWLYGVTYLEFSTFFWQTYQNIITFDSNIRGTTCFFSRIWIITRQPFSLNVGHSKKFGSFIVSKLLKHNHETCALRFRWNDVRVVWSKTFSNSIMWKDYLLFFESQRWPWMNHVPTSCWLWLTFHKLPTHLRSST
jgi:hypothetical protein